MSTITVSPSGLKFISDIVKEISKIENSWFDLDLSSQNAIKNILSKYELNQKDPNSRNDMFQLLFSNIIQDLYGNEIYDLLLFIFKFSFMQKKEEKKYFPTLRECNKKILCANLKDFMEKYRKLRKVSLLNYIFNLKEGERKLMAKILSYLIGG
jgi:hypothetical protein